MPGLSDWKLKKFEPEVERHYIREQLDRVVVFGRVGTIVAILSYVGYAGWDLLIDPDALSRTWPIRVVAIAYFALSFWLTFWKPVSSSSQAWIAFVFTNYLAVAVAFAWILALMPGSFTAGVPGFLLGMILTPVVIVQFRQSLLLLLPLFVVPILIMYWNGGTSFEIANAAAWLGGGVLYVMGFAYVIQVINRRTFGLEQSLEVEKQRSETLLLNILPERIANRLKSSEAIIADNFPAATVLFGDIVGFTELAARLSPSEIVTLLNDLFSRFDRLAERHGVEKIKTIGDGYMVAAGVPTSRPDHAEAIAKLALDMRDAFLDFRRENGLDIGFRIGAHSGSVVAGVIGARKFAYDLWGDTVNVASRMESQGLPNEIQISAVTRALLPAVYRVEERGALKIEGHKAEMAYLLKELRAA
jgi:class 3 adenylate cyclase